MITNTFGILYPVALQSPACTKVQLTSRRMIRCETSPTPLSSDAFVGNHGPPLPKRLRVDRVLPLLLLHPKMAQ